LLYNESFPQLLTPGARVGNTKITVYMGTECLQNLNVQSFTLRLLTYLVRGFMFRSGPITVAQHKISKFQVSFLHSSI